MSDIERRNDFRARITELEAEVVRLSYLREAAANIAALDAERAEAARDNANRQLIAALEAHSWGECLGYVHSARAALSDPLVKL